MDSFRGDLTQIVRSIPSGKVMSYGQVAAYAGVPKASREVGWAMRDLGSTPDFPWWRVLNTAGQISIENPDVDPETQQRLLEEEGIVFMEPLKLDIEKYRYRPDKETLNTFRLDSDQVEEVFEKYGTSQLPLL